MQRYACAHRSCVLSGSAHSGGELVDAVEVLFDEELLVEVSRPWSHEESLEKIGIKVLSAELDHVSHALVVIDTDLFAVG